MTLNIFKIASGSAKYCLLLQIKFYWDIVAPMCLCVMGFPGGSEGKVSACNEGDPGSIPGLGRSPGEGNGNPLQYSGLENPMDGEVCRLQFMGSQRDMTEHLNFLFQAEKRHGRQLRNLFHKHL